MDTVCGCITTCVLEIHGWAFLGGGPLPPFPFVGWLGASLPSVLVMLSGALASPWTCLCRESHSSVRTCVHCLGFPTGCCHMGLLTPGPGLAASPTRQPSVHLWECSSAFLSITHDTECVLHCIEVAHEVVASPAWGAVAVPRVRASWSWVFPLLVLLLSADSWTPPTSRGAGDGRLALTDPKVRYSRNGCGARGCRHHRGCKGVAPRAAIFITESVGRVPTRRGETGPHRFLELALDCGLGFVLGKWSRGCGLPDAGTFRPTVGHFFLGGGSRDGRGWC